jgi:hypothetical protein
MTEKIDIAQKIKWLEIWNSTLGFCISFIFSKMFNYDKAFHLWLHKQHIEIKYEYLVQICFDLKYYKKYFYFVFFNIFVPI